MLRRDVAEEIYCRNEQSDYMPISIADTGCYFCALSAIGELKMYLHYEPLLLHIFSDGRAEMQTLVLVAISAMAGGYTVSVEWKIQCLAAAVQQIMGLCYVELRPCPHAVLHFTKPYSFRLGV
jgi:hypothetical protein